MKRLELGLFNVGASVCVLQQVALKDNLFNDNLYFKCGHSQSSGRNVNLTSSLRNTLTSWFFLDFTSAF